LVSVAFLGDGFANYHEMGCASHAKEDGVHMHDSTDSVKHDAGGPMQEPTQTVGL
jgi:hypothetical protein